MTKFLNRDAIWKLADDIAGHMHDRLPAGCYTVQASLDGFYLEQVDSFTRVPKLYGTTARDADRILRTFLDRPEGTGVMLSGLKGSGKTLLAKTVSIEAAEQMDMPTILVGAPYHGEGFFRFLQAIDQPAIVLFDEYEKVYSDEDHQNSILTLLDGTFPSKKLYLLTVNDKYAVSVNMRNRPGRVFYHYEFGSIDRKFIEEYARDNLKPELHRHVTPLIELSMIFFSFNFDMLKAMVEEMNRYGETPREVLTVLNVKPEFTERILVDATYELDGVDVTEAAHGNTRGWSANPIALQVNPMLNSDKLMQVLGQRWTKPEGERAFAVVIESDHLVQLDSDNGCYRYERQIELGGKARTFTLTLRRQPAKTYKGWSLADHDDED